MRDVNMRASSPVAQLIRGSTGDDFDLSNIHESSTRPLGAGGAGGCWNEPKKGLKIWRKGSILDVSRDVQHPCVALFFPSLFVVCFACQRCW